MAICGPISVTFLAHDRWISTVHPAEKKVLIHFSKIIQNHDEHIIFEWMIVILNVIVRFT